MSYLSVSTWSLHRILGPLRWTSWDAEAGKHITQIDPQPQLYSLLELPAEAARRGYDAIEVGHFHYPSKDPAYLAQLKQAFADAGIRFDTLLLDYGDLTTEEPVRWNADYSLILEWIEIASLSGARQIRIVGGEAQPSDERAISRAAKALSELAEFSATFNVRIITENFKPLTSTGASSWSLLEQAGPSVGFITDFGNYKGAAKYDEIALTAPRSVSVHAKASYDDNGMPDEAEFVRCLDVSSIAGFEGAYVLIYDGPGNMWEGLDRIKGIVERYL
jgi:sugar phosphate isomerase/epimerase